MLDWLFSIPLWLVIVLIALPAAAAVVAISLGAAAAAGDRALEEASRTPSICTCIDAVGDEADQMFREAA